MRVSKRVLLVTMSAVLSLGVLAFAAAQAVDAPGERLALAASGVQLTASGEPGSWQKPQQLDATTPYRLHQNGTAEPR